ncbi:MAG: glycyl-radical enzyme activating protein [Acidobacteria bacterium]|nr:glycyl-radical enzyme activating protein [Acidobacteriota bacterium]
MDKELTGKVYDIQGFSVQDGPGIRTTVFMKGCPMRCPWCHSPESQAFHAQLLWIAMKCAGLDACTKCLDACPRGAIFPGKTLKNEATRETVRHIRIDRAICDDCGDCARICVRNALTMCGTDYTVEDLLERVIKDKPFYDRSGGGVTISGGEPLSQPEFVSRLLERLKACGVHTAVDTTGYAQYDVIRNILPHADLFLYDLKHMDSRRHQTATGVPNQLILENAKKIAQDGGKMQIRIPVIPDFNDSDESVRETGLFCRSLGQAVTVVQLLPYHNLGAMKYLRLDDGRSVPEAEPPTEGKISILKALLQDLGLPVTVH